MLSFIAYKDTGYYAGQDISIRVASIDTLGRSTDLVNTTETLTAEVQTIEIPFTTNNDTDKIIIYLSTQDRANCSFYITAIKCPILYARHTIRYLYACKSTATTKSTSPYARHTIRYLYACKITTVFKCT